MNDVCFFILRALVFLLNLFFWVTGLGTLGLGLWLRFDPSVSELIALREDEKLTLENLNLACYLLIISGAIMSIIGFLGCCGAWRLSQCMLVTFFIILVIVFCLELACAIFAYTHQDLIRKYIDNSMYEVVHKYYASRPEYARIFDRIQIEFECCGVKSYKDWLHSSWGRSGRFKAEIGIGSGTIGRVPASCCNEQGLQDYPTNCGVSFDKLELWTYEPFLNTKGCSEALYQTAYNNLEMAIILCVIIGTIQLFGMFFSMLLCCWINASNKRKVDDI
uniref:Tetraspanin n=1 Tax=Acrobeloides nanus TaxID=290746 RepID=A0A914EC31_9BILA